MLAHAALRVQYPVLLNIPRPAQNSLLGCTMSPFPGRTRHSTSVRFPGVAVKRKQHFRFCLVLLSEFCVPVSRVEADDKAKGETNESRTSSLYRTHVYRRPRTRI